MKESLPGEKRLGDSQKSAEPSPKKVHTMAAPMHVDAPKALDEDLHRRGGSSGAGNSPNSLPLALLLPRSRQLAVYGRETMRRLASARVLVVGLNGLGVEVGAWESFLVSAPATQPNFGP